MHIGLIKIQNFFNDKTITCRNELVQKLQQIIYVCTGEYCNSTSPIILLKEYKYIKNNNLYYDKDVLDFLNYDINYPSTLEKLNNFSLSKILPSKTPFNIYDIHVHKFKKSIHIIYKSEIIIKITNVRVVKGKVVFNLILPLLKDKVIFKYFYRKKSIQIMNRSEGVTLFKCKFSTAKMAINFLIKNQYCFYERYNNKVVKDQSY